MSLEEKSSAVTALSGLTIDVDKNWLAFGISNIKEVVAGMATGDITYHDGTKLVKLSPGVIGTCLKTKGPAFPPIWSYADVLP
jgi:hypothetical protein